jgi:hypothetical protein
MKDRNVKQVMLREGTGGRGRVKEVNVVDVLFIQV